MSCWTYIHAMVEVNFGNQSKYRIMNFLADCKGQGVLPGIRPEAQGEVGVRGHRVRDERDNGRRTASRPCVQAANYVENEWVITISGALRDRVMSETKKEWDRFLWKLAWFVHKECKTMDRWEGYDNRMPWSQILYYHVDINNGYKRYTRSSIDRRFRDTEEEGLKHD